MADVIHRSSFVEDRFVVVIRLCAQREAVELGRLLPENDRFTDAYDALTKSELERYLDPAPLRSSWSDPARVVGLAAVHLAHVESRPTVTESVLDMLDDLAIAMQIWDDLFSVAADLAAERRTYPILVAMKAAGIPEDAPMRPFEVLGALATTDALATILATASRHLESARRAAAGVPLPTFVAYLDAVRRDAAMRQAQLLSGSSLVRTAWPDRAPTAPSPVATSTLAKSIAMAEAFLLSDLTFRESWETHREGMLGADQVVSRFPAALILEILCRRGRVLTEHVDAWLAHSESTGFRYYDHPGADPDSDSVGAALMLLRYSSRSRDGLSQPLWGVLDCVASIVQSRGEVPVWLTECRDSQSRPQTRALGEGCATVAARLLIGLSGLGGEHEATFKRGASAILDRVADVGLGANVNYPPRYALAMYLELARLDSHERARAALMAELEKRSAAPARGAQEASLAVLAARAGDQPLLIDQHWIETILKQQRFDGSWIGESFAMAPNRGWRVSPYSSTTLTTALCYDALADWSLIGEQALKRGVS